MEGTKLQELVIHEYVFRLAFDRDVDYRDKNKQSANLDKQTGKIDWFYEEDFGAVNEGGITAEENRAERQRIEAMPDRYLEIPGLSHGVIHDLLKDFFSSNWTDNDGMRQFAKDAYFGSIGGWIENVGDESIIRAFEDFRDRKTKEMAEEFLRSHGIKPVWK
jgi:hypothetical protein